MNNNLREKYKKIFKISEEDYQKAKISQKEENYYDIYLEIFDNLVDNNKNKKKLKEDIEKSNPWKTSNSSNNKYKFKSLAVSDREILERLLILNIDELNQNGKTEAESIIESRFDDFEHAFDGNFINPKVILLGINPKMASNHKPYGLENTVYKEPFNEKCPVLNHPEDDFNNDYYFKKSGFFYTKDVPENIRKKHIELSTDPDSNRDSDTPFALLEVFPYASENVKEWQKGYKISHSLRPYFNLKKTLPSQIWLVCLLTYAIKNTTNLFLYLRINNRSFRNNFLDFYFEKLDLNSSEHIKVITKKSSSNQVFSKNNIKPYFKRDKLKVRTDSEETFFEDIWGISLNQN